MDSPLRRRPWHHVEVFARSEHHLGTEQPSSVPIADHTVFRHDQRQALGPEPDGVGELHHDIDAPKGLSKQTLLAPEAELLSRHPFSSRHSSRERAVQRQVAGLIQGRYVEKYDHAPDAVH
jgi:hypothetical protein